MKKILALCCICLFLTNCEDDATLNPDGFTEFPVNINGSWSIDKVTQNGNDITDKLPFQSFTLNLDYNGDQPTTFSIPTFDVPFGIDFGSGTWMFDDLTYPTKLIFTSTQGTSTTVDIATIPVVQGSNMLNLTFKLGCDSNKYVYSLKKN